MWTKESRKQFSETHTQKFNCERCGKYCEKPHQSHKLRFCSKSCSAIGNQQWLGKKHTEKTKQQMSDYWTEHPKRFVGEKHWNWKGGITFVGQGIRKSIEYKEWVKKIFDRDNYTCQKCGYSYKDEDNWENRIPLNAHHRIKVSKLNKDNKFIKYIFDIRNGITLCLPCHNLTK